MYLMTQIAVYQYPDGTIGISRTNDLRNWFWKYHSDLGGIELLAVYPIKWEFQAAFMSNLKNRLKDVLETKLIKVGSEEYTRKSYKISADDLYNLFAELVEDFEDDTYIPSCMVELAKNSIPNCEIWNFDFWINSKGEQRSYLNRDKTRVNT